MRRLGLWTECPGDVDIAWGSRATCHFGRFGWNAENVSYFGPKAGPTRDDFFSELNSCLPAVRNKAVEFQDKFRPRSHDIVVLYESDGIVVKASMCGSIEYLYFIAYKPKARTKRRGR